jgi:ribulose-phosphate 3-epimerase
VNPATSLDAISDVAPHIDLLVIMSVQPGFGGQSYIEASTAKVERARGLLDGLGSTAELEVDGGVDTSNAAMLQDAGASVLVAGSSVYRHPDGAREGVLSIRAALST